jgi:hypothetical protein
MNTKFGFAATYTALVFGFGGHHTALRQTASAQTGLATD